MRGEGDVLQRFAVAGNHGFIPVEALLTGTGHVTGAVVCEERAMYYSVSPLLAITVLYQSKLFL
ncbi:hypothetical protein K1V05_13265, partial [Enterobacter mori]